MSYNYFNSLAQHSHVACVHTNCYSFKIKYALGLTNNAIRLLDQWKIRYTEWKKDMQVLSALYFTRWAWDFDEDIIFNRLNFVHMVVNDIQKIMEVNLIDK